MFGKQQLTVIIVSYNSKRTIEDCLTSLKNQTTVRNFEIIVVDSSTDDTAKLIEERFPEVNLYKFQERKYPESARNIGISVAKGEIVAFIDADCVADRNWVDEILKAHNSSVLALGGAIANGNTDSCVGWAAYFCELSQWMPDKHYKWMEDIAATGMSYKREVFEKYGYFIEGIYCADTEFHWRLQQNGIRLLFVPTIIVYHRYIDNLRVFLMHEYGHGQSFARVRLKAKKFSKLKRFIYVIFLPVIALKLIMKTGLINVKNRVYMQHYLKVLPLLTIGIIFWSIGECVGYAKGRKSE